MIKYQLKNNGGNNNNDCLLIAIGRLDNPNLNEKNAVAQGWQAVFDGVNTMKADDLTALYTELKNAYAQNIPGINNYFSLDFDQDESIKAFETELKNTFGVNNLSPDIVQAQLHEKVKQEVNGFLKHLQQQPIQKYIELLKVIPDNKKQNLMLVSNNDLQSHLGQVYEQFKEFILAGKVPHFLVHNGAHYSNIIPTHIDYNAHENALDPEALIKQDFVNLMNNALALAAGFTHPAVSARQSRDQSASYTLDMLNNDLQFAQEIRQAMEESLADQKKQILNQSTAQQSKPVVHPVESNGRSVEKPKQHHDKEQVINEKLTQLLEFIHDNIDPAYKNNSNYTYQLSHAGTTYNVPWSLMQAYDARTFGSYDHAKILAGLKEDFGQDNEAMIAEKLRAPMYGVVWNNTHGVTKTYLEALQPPSKLNEVIMPNGKKTVEDTAAPASFFIFRLANGVF